MQISYRYKNNDIRERDSFTTKNDRPYPQGFQLSGTTRDAQTSTVSITVNPT